MGKATEDLIGDGTSYSKTPITGLAGIYMPFWLVGYIKNRRRIQQACQSAETALGEYLTLKAKYKSAFIYKVSPPTTGTVGGIDRTSKGWYRK